MLGSLPAPQVPLWLTKLNAGGIESGRVPIEDLLHDSLYYPSCGFDGDPVRRLAGNIYSFIYVDYGQRVEDLDRAISLSGFRGYCILGRREVPLSDLALPTGTPRFLKSIDGDPTRHSGWIKEPFCTWIVFQRVVGLQDSHGPHRFSLIYLCAEGVTAFQALYIANKQSPAAVAVIQPGHGFGRNWTNFEDAGEIFARTVLENPAGRPRILLHGGHGRRYLYRQPCWPQYSNFVCFFDKASRGTIGVWEETKAFVLTG